MTIDLPSNSIEREKPRPEREARPEVVPPPNPEDLISTIPEPIHASGPRLTAWIYEPGWPREGERQRIVAPIPNNKQTAIEIAKEGFPSLQSVRNERISFSLTARKDFKWSGPKLRIVDSAWESMSQSSARVINVSVEPTPKEIAERKARDDEVGMVFMGVGCGILAVAAICVLRSYGGQLPNR